MKKTKLLVGVLGALFALAAPGAFAAAAAPEAAGAGGVGSELELISEEESPVSANITLVSNYLYRGISQTGGRPAVQGGFDYEHKSGFYLGAWGSNSSFFSDLYTDRGGREGAINASLELDTYLGFKNKFAKNFSYDVGFLRYNFPGAYAPGAISGDTQEIYGQLGYKWITVKYSYSLGQTFGVDKAKGTNYVEANVNYEIVDGLSLGAHAGRQTFKGAVADALAAAGASPSYTDYKLGLVKEIDDYQLGLAYSKTTARTGAGSFYNILGRDLGKGVAILSLSRTF